MFLDSVRDYLISLGVVGGVTGWPCYIGLFPDDQDRCVGIFPTGGYPADTLARENERLTFQTRVRAGRFDFPIAFAKWEEIFNALQDAQEGSWPTSPDPLEGFVFVQAMQQGPLQFNDSNGRVNMTSNWRVLRVR
jgi:hypothetical protein